MTNIEMQDLCRATMEYAKSRITAGMSLVELRELCEGYMLQNGADSFWYWGVGAFVFSGDETAVSVSGKEYITSNRTIKENDIVTIDLSPQNNCVWGDYARTIIIERGRVVSDIDDIRNDEWRSGLLMEDFLHKTLVEIAKPDMSFEELYFCMNKLIADKGFVNLDFMGNLGHSIVSNKDDRIYIEKGNKSRLSEAAMFTFEPHISLPGSKYGYKKEDIYYFEGDRLVKA